MQKYYLGFSLFPGIGTVFFSKLLEKFGSAQAAWESPEEKLQAVLGEKLARQFSAFRKNTDLAKEEEKIYKKNMQLVTWESTGYPNLLRQIKNPPFLLYVKGNVAVLSSEKIIGIVGTRKITEYGYQVTKMLTQDLVRAGFTTVSGLAFGVDATVHTETINSTGKTIAVLGCGVDCCTPRANQKIYDAILASGGAIISSFKPSETATKGSFPARNAIIAGLAQAILVTEGAADSGSLITAKDAKKFGRTVFAVPGPITSSLSKGANNLIQHGAIAVQSAADMLDTLGIMGNRQESRQVVVQDGEKQKIIDVLKTGPLHFDEIVRSLKKDSKEIGSLLSLMELEGLIQSTHEGRYSL